MNHNVFWKSNPTNIESPSGECFAGDGNTLATGGKGIFMRGEGLAKGGGNIARGGNGLAEGGGRIAKGGNGVAAVGGRIGAGRNAALARRKQLETRQAAAITTCESRTIDALTDRLGQAGESVISPVNVVRLCPPNQLCVGLCRGGLCRRGLCGRPRRRRGVASPPVGWCWLHRCPRECPWRG